MFKRILQIIFVLLKYSFSDLPKPLRVRRTFEELGGAFVKFGQILALRSDLIPEDIAFELLNLLDRMPEVPPSKIRQVIRQALGKEVEDLFLEFEFAPLAAASFAQIHRARLPSGEPVVVKIQRPGTDQIVKTDLKILRGLGRLIDFLGFKGPIKARQIIAEFAEWTWRELDYRLEGQGAEQLGLPSQVRTLEIKFPKVFWQYTSRRVLVEEFIEGQNLKEIMVQGGPPALDRDLLSKRLIENAMQQYFLFGRFHGDPHPANILVDGKNNIGMVDFGIMGQSQELERIAMANFAYQTMKKNYPEAVTAFLHLGLVKQLGEDLPYLLEDRKFAALFIRGFGAFKEFMTKRFTYLIERWHSAIADPEAAFGQKSAASTFLQILSLASHYRVVLGREIVMFIKTLIAVDAISLKIIPSFNLAKTVSGVFAKPEYSQFFSAAAQAKLNEALAPLTSRLEKNLERTQLLKDYYLEWFERIAEMHEEEFREIFKKKEPEREELIETVLHPSGLPSWIVAMHESLGHNHKYNY